MTHRGGKAMEPRRMLLVCACAAMSACTQAPETGVRVVPQVGPAQPRRVAFSPRDRARLLVVEASGRVGVWDLERPAEPVLFASIPAGALDATFAPDGRSLLSAGFDGRVRRWSVDGRLIWASESGHAAPARAVAEGAGIVASGGDDGALRLWTTDGALLGSLAGNEISVLSLVVSAGGEIVSLAGNGTVRRWQRDRGDQGRPPAFRPSILFRDVDPRDPQTLTQMLKFDATWGWQHAVVAATDGAIGGAPFDGSVRLWNADGTPRAAIPNAHRRRHVGALALSPAGDLLASAGGDGTVRLWNLDGSARGNPIEAHVNIVFSVTFSADGRRLATAGADDRVRLWDVDGGRAGELPPAPAPAPAVVALSPSEPLLAVAAADGIHLWNLDGTARGTAAAPAPATSLAFAPRGDLLAAGSVGSVRLFSNDGGARGEPFSGNRYPVTAVAFSPDAGRLAAASDALRIFDPAAPLWQAPAVAPDSLSAVAVAPDGEYIATGSQLGRIQVWNRDGSPRMAPRKLPKEYIAALAFVNGGEGFATAGGSESVVRLWHLDGSELAPPLEGHFATVTALASSADASLLASGGDDGTVRIWSGAARGVQVIDVGLPVDQIGFRDGALWARAGSWTFFYDRQRHLVATAVLGDGAPILFTPDGWYAGRPATPGSLLLFARSGDRLSAGSAERRFAPQRVGAALRSSAD